MKNVTKACLLAAVFAELSSSGLNAQQALTADADGTVHPPALAVPFSSLATPEAKKNFLDLVHGISSPCMNNRESDDINVERHDFDDCLLRPGVAKLRSVFAVEIKPQRIADVSTDVIEPAKGIAAKNKRRVLINLHGGGFYEGAGLGGQMESIPISALGAIKVISVDYREGPEHRFPAASEDVAAVYRELLKTYPAKNIGIYGCSAGGILTAESVSWFQTHGLPRPGAIGMFGSGALLPMPSDSLYFGWILTGGTTIAATGDVKKFLPYFDVPELNIRDPLVSPIFSPSVVARFPSSLLISGTRDAGLSGAAYTHAQLVKAGVDAELHVWEGAAHCIFAVGVVDPGVPETREAWQVIISFFDKHLGK